MEYEVFIFYQHCPNIDPLCRIDHDEYKAKSQSGKETLEIGKFNIIDLAEIGVSNNAQINLSCPLMGCGVCGLWFLKEMRDLSLKIPCRGRTTNKKVSATRLVSKLLNVIESNNIDISQYRKMARYFFMKEFKQNCNVAFCYCEGSWKADFLNHFI